jgi:DnaJ-class molecular chaperone
MAFIGYYFYKNSVKTGKFKQFLRRSLPNLINALQEISDKIEGAKRQRTRWGSGNINKMSVEEARQVLGVRQNATREEINSSFKKLMLINHPDKGGSQYIAAKIIEAKQTLIND